MKKFVFLFLFIFGSNSFAQSICSDPNVPTLVNTGLHAFSDNEFTKSIETSAVNIVGEIHFFTELQARLELIKKFNSIAKGKKCVAYEWAKKEYDFIEFMNRIKQSINGIKESAFAAENPQIKAADIQHLVPIFEQIYDYYWPMAELTQVLGMKAVMVDHKDHNFTSAKSMDERNSGMAENLYTLLKNQDCDSILFFVGKAHLARNTDSTTRVQDLVRAKNISVNTISLQMTRESLPLVIRSWTICQNLNSIKLNDYAFIKNSELTDDHVLFPYMQNELTTWKDFDFTLLAP